MYSVFRSPKTWTDFMYLRKTGREIIKYPNDKDIMEKFFKENDFPHSKIINKFDSIDELFLKNVPDYFVLKPTNLWSAAGVMLLHKINGTNLFFNAMNKSVVSELDIRNELVNVKDKFKASSLKTILEERVIDEDVNFLIPLDYKFYIFNGKIKFVTQVDRNFDKLKLVFFDEKFNPIYDDRISIGRPNVAQIGEPRRPTCYKELSELACKVSKRLETPFVRVDCYASKNGPVVGEITYTPGAVYLSSTYRLSDDFDRELGECWEKACKELKMDIPLIENYYEIIHKGKLYRTVPPTILKSESESKPTMIDKIKKRIKKRQSKFFN